MRNAGRVLLLPVLAVCLFASGWAQTQEPKRTHVVPTHPRLAFRKDDLAKLRQRCLTTHAKEYALLKANADTAVFLETRPVAPGLLWQLTGESRYLRWAESDYDAFHEVLDPAKAYGLANEILYEHRRRMATDGTARLGGKYYMHLFKGRSAILTIVGDDVPLARPGELDARLRVLSKVFGEARQIYDLVSYRRGGKATSFHCACFFKTDPQFYEKWRVVTGENYFDSTLMTGLILQAMHNTLPHDHACATMTNSWGHDHLGRPADYIIASRCHDGLCQWVMHNPEWVTRRKVGKHDPADFDALGHAWEVALDDLGGYKEGNWSGPVAYWVGHMPRRILYYDPDLKEVPPQELPTSALFEGLGIVCTRSAWTDDAVFARIHSGADFRGEPPHLNDNTFHIYHKGWLVIPERGGTGWLTSLTNSILVKDPDEKIMRSFSGLWADGLWNGKIAGVKEAKENDGGQSYWREDLDRMDLKCRGVISAYEATDLYTYAVGDATKSYNPAKLKSFTRQFLHLKPGLVIVFDRVTSTKPEFEKRWVLHTRGEPRQTDEQGVFMADAVSTAGWSPRGYRRTPGFDVPKTDEGPPKKFTLTFRTQWDGVDVGLAYKAGPEYGKLKWSLDDGKQKGELDQHSDKEKARVSTILATNIPKGSHTLIVEEKEGKINVAHFPVRLGGRVFVRTLLPEKSAREVTPNTRAEQDPYHLWADWRTDVIATEARTDDVFLNVLEATDRSQQKPVPVKRTDDGTRIVLRFDYQGKNYEVTFNRTGEVGGRVKVQQDGKTLLDRALATRIVDTDDAHIESCRALIRENPEYDYDVSEIAHLSPKADRGKLIGALSDRRWYVRFYAVRALEAKRDRAASALLMMRLKDDDARVAGTAAEALGRIGAREYAGQLVKALASDKDELRFYAAWALGELKAREALDPLVKLLADPNDFVSVSAAEALGKIGDERAAGALARALNAHDATHMKTTYLSALAAIGGDTARKHLQVLRESDDRALHVCALAGLVKLADENAEPLLKAALEDKDKGVRAWAQRRLLKPGDESYLKRMLAMAKNTEAKFPARRDAITTLGEERYKPAVEDLAKLLEEQQVYLVRRTKDAISTHAALALYRLGDPRGVGYLKKVILDNNRERGHLAAAAAKSFRSVDKETAVPILMDALQLRKQRALGAIVESLHRLTGEDAGADIEFVGHRRVGRDVAAWKKWWEKKKGKYDQ